jgi:apolipoprotein N-acyltransferase
VLQSQQVASSRLRAIEQNRWVVQASPTGFSAFVSPEGEVYQRTSVSEQEVITRTIELRGVRTWYSHTGDTPWVLLMALLLALSTWRSRPFPRFPRFPAFPSRLSSRCQGL